MTGLEATQKVSRASSGGPHLVMAATFYNFDTGPSLEFFNVNGM